MANMALAAQNSNNVATEPSFFVQLIPIMLIMLVFYFLIIRPQQNKLKNHKSMISKLKVGDIICTNDGLQGSVLELSEEEIILRISNGITIQVNKGNIVSIYENQAKSTNTNK